MLRQAQHDNPCFVVIRVNSYPFVAEIRHRQPRPEPNTSRRQARLTLG